MAYEFHGCVDGHCCIRGAILGTVSHHTQSSAHCRLSLRLFHIQVVFFWSLSLSVFVVVTQCFSSSSLLAFPSRVTWQYSIVAEVFSMNNLFTALHLWLIVEFSDALCTAFPRSGFVSLFPSFCTPPPSHKHTLVLIKSHLTE